MRWYWRDPRLDAIPIDAALGVCRAPAAWQAVKYAWVLINQPTLMMRNWRRSSQTGGQYRAMSQKTGLADDSLHGF